MSLCLGGFQKQTSGWIFDFFLTGGIFYPKKYQACLCSVFLVYFVSKGKTKIIRIPSWKRASKKFPNQENSSKSFEVPGRGLGITWCTHPHSTYPWPASIQRSGLFSSSLSNHKDGWTTPSQKQGSCHTAITSDYSGTNQTGFGQFIIKEERWIYRLGESLSFLIVLLFFSGCLKCMIIYQKHFNVLQYRESKQSHHNMMRRGAGC